MTTQHQLQPPGPAISAADHDALKSELAVCCRQLQSKEQALKILKQELDISREKVDHSRQEIAQLRSQLARSSSTPKEDIVQEREQFIAHLEASQEKIAELERQLQMEEDEKEEVLGQRDYFSSQCAALKKCLEEKENAQPPSQSALQTLAEENRQLKLKLVEVQAERDQAQARVDRYKRTVERRKTHEAKEQTPNNSGKQNNLRQSMRRVAELEALANSLSESVKEKSIALSHQKKANKMLGARVADLEHRLKVFEISGLWSAATSGPVLDLTWNEDGRDGMELMTPQRDLVVSSQAHSSLTHTSPPPHGQQSSQEFAPVSSPPQSPHHHSHQPPTDSSPSSHHHQPPNPEPLSPSDGADQVAGDNQAAGGGEGGNTDPTSLPETPVALA